MTTFRDRDKEIERLCTDPSSEPLLNVHGETGIGKSRILTEAARMLQAKPPPSPLILKIDLQSLADPQMDRLGAVIRMLLAQAKPWLDVLGNDNAQVAGQIVAQLSDLSSKMPVHLMFDTTEAVQADMSFWSWMEEHLVGPLVLDSAVKQIYAGRVPVPWRRYEIRRVVRYLALEPLSPREEARALVWEVLSTHRPDVGRDCLDQATDLVLEFSFMHPKLSEDLAAFLAPHLEGVDFQRLHDEYCPRFVKTFIDTQFFNDIENPWKEILWWLSAVEWFDPMILRRYLEIVDPELVAGKNDHFYIEGVTQLRLRKTVIWREERGDRLHGVIRDITRHCMRVLDFERYQKASLAAAETFAALAAEFPEGTPEYSQYRELAGQYSKQAEQEDSDE